MSISGSCVAYLVGGTLVGIVFGQAMPADGTFLGLPPGLVNALSGSAIGGVALGIYAFGTAIVQPYLREKGTQAKLDDAAGRITANEQEIRALQARLDEADVEKRKYLDALAAAAQRLAGATNTMGRMAQVYLEKIGRFEPEPVAAAEEADDDLISDHPPEPTGPKVLLVEDAEDARLPLTIRLEQARFRVVAAATRAEGLAKLDDSIDAVILDLMLPDGDGLDILKAIRRVGLGCRVIVTTGRDQSLLAPVRDLLAAGDHLLTKPVRFRAQLLPALRGQGVA